MITLSSSFSVAVYEDSRQVQEKAPSSTCASYNELNTYQELNDDTSLSTVIPELFEC
jgi:butyrate kinase